MRELVVVKQDELFVSTWELAKGFHSEHRHIKMLIDSHLKDFEEVGDAPVIREKNLNLRSQIAKSNPKGAGRPVIEYFLNEPQATYLVTLLKNNKIINEFKKHLTKEFFRQRKMLHSLLWNKKDADWLQKRAMGKIERRLETDQIKKFVQYAKAQGSIHADKYYMIITKMENHSLFHLEFLNQKYKNLRDVLDGLALDIVKMADIIVAKALEEGMNNKMIYKDIYILARDRVEGFALSIGKTPLRLIINDKREQKLISNRNAT